MIIDSHLHIWSLARGDYTWLTPDLSKLYFDHQLDDILPLFEQQGVSKCILVQAAPSVAETHYLLTQAQIHSEHVAGVIGWIDFASNQALEQLEELSLEPLIRGIRPMLQDLKPDSWILQAQFAPVFQGLINKGLVFDALVSHAQLPVVYELASRYPELKIVIDHCGKPDLDNGNHQSWLADLTKLAQFPQISIKLSGLPAQSTAAFNQQHAFKYVSDVICLYGADRVLWGSDWPVVKLASDYRSWLNFCQQCCQTLKLCSLQQASIFYRTAVAVYGLSTSIEPNK